MAARTAYEALDAATSPEPRVMSGPSKPVARASQATAHRVSVLRPDMPRATASTRPGRPRAGMFAPVRRASRAVSLEVTGSFFALFALSFSVGMWHARAELHAGAHGMARFAAYGLISLFFMYCAVSSFVRAKRLT